ncbi:mesenteric estrogen-dependent adipogenesis protein [Amia ocellicauda]|uniref:mesenteric estrogen-dependent adipogenesis protein n=1 Tax=Amia ocellicauda TaxID=2972642 RepID=UPI003463B786
MRALLLLFICTCICCHFSFRTIKARSLQEYAHIRASLTSKQIFILVSACDPSSALSKKKVDKGGEVLKHLIVPINGSHPGIQWEIEKGLDWAISSVAGESYHVRIDVKEALQNWANETGFEMCVDGRRFKPAWTNTCFMLKCHSDALFDFPFWLGFSNHKFKLLGMGSRLTCGHKGEEIAEKAGLLTSSNLAVHKNIKDSPSGLADFRLLS